jgi:superfamily II DNA or RNA helicase
LKTSPQIPEESIKAVSEKISRGVPFVAPLISEEDELIEFNSKPIINLFLGRKHFSNFSDESETEYMSLEFNYSGYTIFHSDNRQNITYSEAGKTYSITRDFDLEMFAKELILKEGFSEFDKYFISPLEPDLASSIERWRVFKDEIIPKLEKDGWIVFISKEFSYDFQEVESVDINIEDDNDWFSMEISVDIDGKKVSLLPMVTQFLTQVEDIHNLDDKINIPYQDGKFVRVSSQTMKPIIDTIVEIYDGKGDKLKVDAFEAHTIDLFGNTENMIITGSNRLQELSKKLKEFEEISEVPPPKELNAELRDYQKAGINWLNFLREFSFGGILADDMGLGKTIQTLAFLENERENGRLEKPVLVVAPTSLLGNWRREAEKFTPKLEVQIIHGNGRTKKIADMEKYHLNITTFGLIMRDFEKLKGHKFYYIIVDEAQKIKNFQAKTSQYLRQLSTENRIALTGTPMENHLGELWSIFTFLMPGFLGKLENFNKTFRKPIEKDGEDEVRERLKHRIAPFMLRRRKEEVVKELPPKNVIVQAVTLENKQAKLYETVRITMEEKVQRAIAEKGLASSHITILDALLKLRQVCCDPSLLKLEDNKVTESAKLDALSDLLEELVSEGRRILLFSQFTSMLEIIEERITKLGLSYTKLTGSTRDRDSVIEKFKSGEVNIFLISLKAGGVGLNLTEADTVIHYDPWWNPAVEEQATDRAYRIGQDKQVFVYKLIVENSVEEKILGLQEQKRKLTNAMIEDSQEKFQLSQDDIRELFAPIS